jgi:hypothetical protein
MGKGRGSKKGINARIFLGTLLVALLGTRGGLVQKIGRFIQAHCSFAVARTARVSAAHGQAATALGGSRKRGLATYRVSGGLTNARLSAKHRTGGHMMDAYVWLQKLKKLKLLLYFFNFFKPFGSKHTLVSRRSFVYLQEHCVFAWPKILDAWPYIATQALYPLQEWDSPESLSNVQVSHYGAFRVRRSRAKPTSSRKLRR